jgi:flagellar protein FlgJ
MAALSAPYALMTPAGLPARSAVTATLAAGAGMSPTGLGALRQQATALEGSFLNTLMGEMFSSIKSDGLFGGGFGEETWRGMQAEQYANAIAQAGGIGLADQIVSNLLQVQASTNTAATPVSGASK